ncbi:enoyl-CoA hydratase/isomerase family protein [Alicyclobacillus tolerans]|uniref:enoyl-CoA hydratase/isomerase family protein n=1 Tax=Alicyclobacillus tolerans TaxID=90970 RepID=UPI001F3155CD|nr:enoyl-CoA hydratase/isomerase family protein [Alicyclobacillus tolerans]MCF8567952.1 enoyl-CoA hydratase/isomerase family protein [Alicyclobacillus tolerans]
MSLMKIVVDQGVAILTFNRPDKLNALCTPLLEEFRALLTKFEHDDEVQVLILTGEGRSFVAGADIGEYVDQESQQFVDYQKYSRSLFTYLHEYPKPVIAAVNGYALGGGFEIVLCCDIILAGEKAKFGLPESLLGLVPGGGGIQKLARIVGRHLASDVLFTGRRIDATEAMHLHIASQVVSQEELLPVAVRKAKDIMNSGPLAVRELKRLLHECSDSSFEATLSYEQEVLFRMFLSHDGQEGIRAFLQKRKPDFLGR